ncbi:ent-kaurene synthase [Penicillium taxi]|uniref:ent-kaurene synthase n=1 Tax=Penicillium taxi TaxID=168475 RepID=UPI002544DC6A|nr:ent-kaurene synthase [Penicillium taxi]KAJ5907809.1 ent-kaurene synthase [Penicillium taxi]
MPDFGGSRVLSSEANSLLRHVLDDWNPQYGLGNMDNGVYHTAWISLILKADQWVFPECFDFLINTQRKDGSWGNPASEVDQICDGLVSLLSIKRHLKGPVSYSKKQEADLKDRSDRASQFIQTTFSKWNIQSYDITLPIGFEMWFPTVLDLLKEEGMEFTVPQMDWILKIRTAKLAKFSNEDLFSGSHSSALYSLEAFIGKADFSRLGQWKELKMVASCPSATAAYLIEAPQWDEDAELYLRHVVRSTISNNRAVPEMFPSTFFEFSWVVSTLLHSFSKKELDHTLLQSLQDKFVGWFEEYEGLVGSGESVPPEPDSTAKMLTALHLLGTSHSPANMIKCWEGPHHFVTYAGERNASCSTNAHILIALIHLSKDNEYSQFIEKCVRFLCKSWWDTDGILYDKWVSEANVYEFIGKEPY